MPTLFRFFCCLIFGTICWPGRAESPLTHPVPLAGKPADAVAQLDAETAAARALEFGLSGTASALYQNLLATHPESANAGQWRIALATAFMEAGQLDAAAQSLEPIRGTPSAALHLRLGLIAVQRGRTAPARAELALVAEGELTDGDRPWLDFLRAMLAEAAKDNEHAAEFFDKAQREAVNDWQRASFELARQRVRLLSGGVTDEQATVLKTQADRYQGRAIGYDFGRQYAVVLQKLGRREAAIDYLQAQLKSMDSADAFTRDEYRLLLGLIAGVEDPVGRGALETLLETSQDGGRLRMALKLLEQSVKNEATRNHFLGFVDQLIARQNPSHPILENLLLVRAEFALKAREFDAVEQNAKALLAQFPNSDLRALALTQLAESAWVQNRFLTAADLGAQARAAAKDAQLGSRLGVFVAEAYYRAKDYRSAGEAYAAALEKVPDGVPPGALIFQRVMSELEAGRLNQAVGLLNGFAKDARLDPLNRWRAEWNLAQALQGAGRVNEALQRIRALRAAPDAGGLPGDLRARMSWLQARLALDVGEPAQALDLIGELSGLLGQVSEPLRDEIDSLAHLLSAEAKFKLDRPEDAIAELKQLRGDPARVDDARARSFIVEADYYSRMGRVVEAQALLTKLADDYPGSEYAPDALYKAALNAERRGKDEYFEQAYLLLERLVRDYPKSGLVFYARMHQGDLARRLNDFARAQLIYESLVNTSGNEDGVLAAQLALAATHRAQMAADPSHFGSAVSILERLLDLPNVPLGLRIEAGFQLGDIHAQRAETQAVANSDEYKRDMDKARAIWWPLVSANLLAEKALPLADARARYWMARLLVRMSDIAETEGRREESLEICRLILDKGLPGASLARKRLAGGEGAQ